MAPPSPPPPCRCRSPPILAVRRPSPGCGRSAELEGERFLWYAPHSGFSNQVGELWNAAVAAALLNCTLVVPPVLDHHAVVLGSCPKFRVTDPAWLRAAVWDHAMQLLQDRRYVSVGDIVDLSSIKSMVRTIDFRVFVSLWCGVDMRKTCFSQLCCAVSGGSSTPDDYNRCRSLLSGLGGSEKGCVSGKAVVLPDGMGNLTCLQTLKYVEANEKTIRSLGSLKQMRTLELCGVHEGNLIHLPSSISKMSYLLCLGIVSRDADVQLDLESFSPPPLKLQKFSLTGTLIGNKLPSWFGHLSGLMQLQLHSSKLKEDSIGLLSSLPRLFDLSLVDAYEEKSLIFAAGVFPVLRKLRLDDLANLSHLEFQMGSLVNLDKLILSQCFELTKIPQGIENLVHLKNLELSDMPIELTEQIQMEQESEGKHQDALHMTIVEVLHGLFENKVHMVLFLMEGNALLAPLVHLFKTQQSGSSRSLR